ncbi:MAG: hypothetical protein ACK5O1_07695 [Holosporales bacterium]|jgi:hypothetical protein
MPPPGNPDRLPIVVGTCVAAALPWVAYALLQDSGAGKVAGGIGAVVSASPWLILYAAQRYEEAREKQETHLITTATFGVGSGLMLLSMVSNIEGFAAVGTACLAASGISALLARLTQHNDGQQR